MLQNLSLPFSLGIVEDGLVLREAVEADLDSLMALLADDSISAARGDLDAAEDRPTYLTALRAITDDPANALLVVVNASESLVGTMQLTRIPGMARRGATRLLIEAVRVRSDHRSLGIGAAMMRWVIDSASSQLDADLIQLTSDAARSDAHRFYTRLGFTGSHIGYKYRVTRSAQTA